MTAHNEQSYILDALRSVQTQSWTRIECIVIDDASTDGTLEKALELADGDNRFRVIHHDINGGLSQARNSGIAEARGEFVCFLDGDDFMYGRAVEERLRTIASASDQGWVAGAYCSWHSVPQDAGLSIEGPDGLRLQRRKRVTWFDALFDAPFIASAPIVRTDVVRRLGGFDRTLRSAEDFEFWSRLLRSGYVFDASSYLGIAYRQRVDSMFRATAVGHANNSASVYDSCTEPAGSGYFPPAVVFPYVNPAFRYEADLARFRRFLTSFVSATARGGEEQSRSLLDEICRVFEPYMPRVVDLDRLVRTAATRFLRYDETGLEVRRENLEREVWSALGPRIGIDPAVRQPSSPASELDAESNETSEKLAPVATRRFVAPPRVVAQKSLDFLPGRVVYLMPEAAYHVVEAGPLANELRERAYSPVFLISRRHLPRVATELRKYRVPVVEFDHEDPGAEDLVQRAEALVAYNDWGDARPLIERANELGVRTFAKVEGVQDFEDVDTGRRRRPYQTASHVLYQGENDREALSRPGTVVGSTRLERIWRGPASIRRPPELVVINVNFTYRVLEECRDFWLETAVAACKSTGLDYVLSLHPAERGLVDDPHVSAEPMRHLLTKSSVLVSRFSTVPFEAMARGVPFVYHNPHGERVPTFQDPRGAFHITTDVEGLSTALESALRFVDYRAQCRQFFLRQVDVSDMSSERRTAVVLDELLGVVEQDAGVAASPIQSAGG